MTGVAQVGAQGQLNHLTAASLPVISSSAPTWIPGLLWVNTTTNPPVLYRWNGVAWVAAGTGVNYLALLTADPTGLVNISDLTECQDAGYARQLAPFNPATSTSPVTANNSSLIQFGPFTVNMALPVQWMALVSAQAGNNGQLYQTWTLSQQWQVLATQTIDIPTAGLAITLT